MLPRENRLVQKSDFGKVKQKGKKWQGLLFGLLVLKNNLSCSRFGFIVSTKISKRATLRNKVKRQLRESIWKILPIVKPGFDVLILTKREMLDKKLVEVASETDRMLETAGILNEKK